MTRFFIIAVLVVAGLVTAPVAWLASGEQEDYSGKVVLHSSYPSKIKSLDPATCGDTISAQAQTQTWEGLYTYHYLKRPIELEPQLAQSLPEISPDGLVYTIKLKQGVKYIANPCFGVDAKGEPLTREVKAEDFILGMKRVADFHIPTPMSWSFLSGLIVGLDDYRKQTEKYEEGDFSRYDLPVEGLKAVDDYTLQVRLIEPFPQMTFRLATHSSAPIPRELIDYYLASEPDGDGGRRPIAVYRRTAEITRVEQVVGTGAYKLTVFDNSRIVFKRNENFRPAFYPAEGEAGDRENGLLDDAGKQVPFIDVLDYNIIEEDGPSWMSFLARQQDTSAIPPDVFQKVISPDQALSESWKKRGIRLVTFLDPSVFWMGFNVADPVIGGSKSLRQAMCLSFDARTYIDVLFNGRGEPPVNTLPSTFPGFKEAGPSPYARFDVAAAKVKFEQAKVELKALGKLDSDGRIPEVVIDLGGRDEQARRQGDFFRQQFAQVGLRVRIELNDWPTLQDKVHNKRTQLYAMGWHADYPDPENFLQLYYGPNVDKGTNSTNYRNPEFDRMYRQLSTIPKLEDRIELYARMVQMLNEDCPVLLMIEPVGFILQYDWVHNSKRHPIGYGNTKYIRIDVDRRKAMGGPS